MGCNPSKPKKIVHVDIPNFKLAYKKFNRQEEIDHFENIFCGKKVQYIKLNLEKNALRQGRMSFSKASSCFCSQESEL